MTNASAPLVLALGDSLTAGYGLAPSACFPAQLQTLLGQHRAGAIVHNAGVSGDTTAGGIRRLPRVLASLSRKPDLAIVELGANDVLFGVPPERTRANLDAILLELGRCGVPALLATFEPPAFLGPTAALYQDIYADMRARHGVATHPFFPPGVVGRPELTLADRIHPNARAIEIVAAAFLPAVLAALDGEWLMQMRRL
ncbi:arylesterase [Sphingomonas sp.]|uniref:arylesterase n=1 Tax=Sphingomonas sp. TaxID=28214 RepID=UPI003AFF962E